MNTLTNQENLAAPEIPPFGWHLTITFRGEFIREEFTRTKPDPEHLASNLKHGYGYQLLELVAISRTHGIPSRKAAAVGDV